MPEEIVEDDEVINSVNDPTSTEEITNDNDPTVVTEIKNEEADLTEAQLAKLKETNQLSYEEVIVATGADLMKTKSEEEELAYDPNRFKSLLKEVFPHVYKQKFGDI